jgi:hypothetical protein
MKTSMSFKPFPHKQTAPAPAGLEAPADLEKPQTSARPPMPRRGGFAPRMADGAPPVDDEQTETQPDDEQAEGEPIAQPDEVGYHQGDEVCSACEHFDAQSVMCQRWNFPVEGNPDGAYCHAFTPMSGREQGDNEEMGEQPPSGPDQTSLPGMAGGRAGWR